MWRALPREEHGLVCDPAIDRKIMRARSLQTSDPETASRLWTEIDRDLTDQAPWVPFANSVSLDVKEMLLALQFVS